MAYVPPVVAIVDPAGNLYCMQCAEECGIDGEPQYADDSALLVDGGFPCRGRCGKSSRGLHDREAKVWEP